MFLSRKGVVCCGWIIVMDKFRFDKSRFDVEDICFVEYGFDEVFNCVFVGVVWFEFWNF